MESMDESPDERHSTESDGDQKRLLLKKNLSWTNSNCAHSNSLAKLKTSRSNPHVLDAVSSASSKLKLATSQIIPNCFHSQSSPIPLTVDDANGRQLAPLAKAISASTLTAATTHQTLATPTSIQLNIPPHSDFKFNCRAILRHCKVNNQTNSLLN